MRQVETPASRATDPVTSHQTAEAVTADGTRRRQQRVVIDTVRRHPGHTSAELARYCSLDRWQVARRLPEAETAEAVKRGGPRRCAVGGRQSMTWWPA